MQVLVVASLFILSCLFRFSCSNNWLLLLFLTVVIRTGLRIRNETSKMPVLAVVLVSVDDNRSNGHAANLMQDTPRKDVWSKQTPEPKPCSLLEAQLKQTSEF